MSHKMLNIAMTLSPVVMAALWPSLAISSPSQQHQIPLLPKGNDAFDWSQISPSAELDYSPCYDGLQCARLDVPLNWNASATENTPRVTIAVIRLPARVSVTDDRYGGAVLVNPGGPGESGIDHVVSRGKAIQTIVDSNSPPEGSASSVHLGAKYFDIIGFDPRGVKYTTPSLKCFPDAFSQQMWLLTRLEYGHVFNSDSAFALNWGRMEALGQRCSAEAGDGDMLRFANTAQVVEDMVEIIERHAQWRQAEAARLLANNDQSPPAEDRDAVLQRTAWNMSRERLQYWGVSYGSLLGQTFAAMHPERVGRLVIDGVLDPDDYYKGTWLANLQDSDLVMRNLCQYCFEAGPSRCPLFTGSSRGDVEALVDHLMTELKYNPIIAPTSSLSLADPIVVTFDNFYLRAINAMAFPFSAAEDFFNLLAEAAKGNVSEVALSKQTQLDTAASLSECRTLAGGCMPDQYFGLLGATPVIECMDSSPYREKTLSKASFKEYLRDLKRQSKWFSLSWANHRMSCIGIREESAWTFDGSIAGNTSHPLLIIGNTYDTVTPLRNARKVSTLFPGSVVLQQNSEGHCSHANPSSCTADKVRRYFQTGELPQPGTTCEPNWRPFLGYSPSNEAVGAADLDQNTRNSLAMLADPWPKLNL